MELLEWAPIVASLTFWVEAHLARLYSPVASLTFNLTFMGYETRIVAFIDILGFGATVKASDDQHEEFDRIQRALGRLKSHFEAGNIIPNSLQDDFRKEFNVDTQVIQVSDSLIISRKVKEAGGVAKMLRDCTYATHLLIDEGFLCRGAIEIGNVYHQGTTIFGTGYQNAYKAESVIPIPVIAFDEKLLQTAVDNPGFANAGNIEFEKQFVAEYCKMLPNGTYYLDYFKSFARDIAESTEAVTEHYMKLREIISKGLLYNDWKVYTKNFWAAHHFNLHADEYGLDQIVL